MPNRRKASRDRSVASLRKAEKALREWALAHLAASEEFPWGESAFKVNKKVFLFLHRGEAGLSLSVKLPVSCDEALLLPFAEPTGYGLGKSGWITATFRPGEEPILPLLRAWIDESYRAVAPKKLSAQLQLPRRRKTLKFG